MRGSIRSVALRVIFCTILLGWSSFAALADPIFIAATGTFATGLGSGTDAGLPFTLYATVDSTQLDNPGPGFYTFSSGSTVDATVLVKNQAIYSTDNTGSGFLELLPASLNGSGLNALRLLNQSDPNSSGFGSSLDLTIIPPSPIFNSTATTQSFSFSTSTPDGPFPIGCNTVTSPECEVLSLVLPGSDGVQTFGLVNQVSFGCAAILQNSVSVNNFNTTITATFTPNFGLTVNKAATDCGYSNFDWQQTITSWPNDGSLLSQNGTIQTAPPSFFDPIAGGYSYPILCGAFPSSSYRSAYPFYYAPNGPAADCWSVAGNENSSGTTLSFQDTPSDACLLTPTGIPDVGIPSVGYLKATAEAQLLGLPLPCGGTHPPVGTDLEFATDLVGVLDGNAADTGIGFNWIDTYNGTLGGATIIGTTANNMLPDTDSGVGSITINSVSENDSIPGITDVPEPPSIKLLVSGIILLIFMRLRRHQAI